MTFAQLKTSLQALGYSTDTDTQQGEAINAAYRELCANWRSAPWLEKVDVSLSTVAGTSEYVLTTITDLVHINSVRVSQGTTLFEELDYEEPDEIERLVFQDRVNSVPHKWSVSQSKLFLYPRPDGVYNLRIHYQFDPADLSAAGDIPAFPATFHDLLVYRAGERMAARQRDWTQAQWFGNQYAATLNAMRATLGIRQRQTSQQVVRTGRYNDLRGPR